MSSSYGNKLARALISSQAHLKACKAIKVSFNPWQLETKSIRDFYHYIQTPSIRISNENCKVQTDIRSDLCEPLLEIKFIDDTNFIFKTKSLTTYDIAREFVQLSNEKTVKDTITDA